MNSVRRRIMLLACAACVGVCGCAARSPSPDSWVSSVLDGDVDLLAACRQALGDDAPRTREASQVTLASAEVVPDRARASRRQTIASRAANDGVVLAAAVEPASPEPPSIALGPASAEDALAAPHIEPLHSAPSARPAAPSSNDACCGCTNSVCGAAPCPVVSACGACSQCLAGGQCKLFTRPEPGPPPMRYYPPMPPRFLPVPTQPVISPARMDAPYPWRGDVEMGFRPQVTFPARD